MDPRCTPQRVFHAHAPHQFAKLAIDLWPPCPIAGFPPPEGPNSSAMPTKDWARRPMGLRLCGAGSWRFIAEPRHSYAVAMLSIKNASISGAIGGLCAEHASASETR